jgi:hypothetical protein
VPLSSSHLNEELLVLLEETRRLARTIADAAISKRLTEIAAELRQLSDTAGGK